MRWPAVFRGIVKIEVLGTIADPDTSPSELLWYIFPGYLIVGVDSLRKMPSIADFFEVCRNSGGGGWTWIFIGPTDVAFSTGRNKSEGVGIVVIFLTGRVFR